jgi:hypothetical protein
MTTERIIEKLEDLIEYLEDSILAASLADDKTKEFLLLELRSRLVEVKTDFISLDLI